MARSLSRPRIASSSTPGFPLYHSVDIEPIYRVDILPRYVDRASTEGWASLHLAGEGLRGGAVQEAGVAGEDPDGVAPTSDGHPERGTVAARGGERGPQLLGAGRSRRQPP